MAAGQACSSKNIRDAGDPVEVQCRYNRARARTEITFPRHYPPATRNGALTHCITGVERMATRYLFRGTWAVVLRTIQDIRNLVEC